MGYRIRIDVRPHVDPTFRAALERACVAASIAGAELDTPDAASIVEQELRTGGYPQAEISLFRSVEEYRTHICNWVVWRDGRPPGGSRSRHFRRESRADERVPFSRARSEVMTRRVQPSTESVRSLE
jgi:hypothetical protein